MSVHETGLNNYRVTDVETQTSTTQHSSFDSNIAPYKTLQITPANMINELLIPLVIVHTKMLLE